MLHGQAFAVAPVALYQQHCAVCHGPGRLGLTGPALLPESLARLRKPEAVKTITGAARRPRCWVSPTA